MRRTTVMIDDLTYEQLRSLARRQGTTTSSVLREAVARYVVTESSRSESPLADFTGLFDGPPDSLGERAKAIAAEAMDVKFAQTGDGRDR